MARGLTYDAALVTLEAAVTITDPGLAEEIRRPAGEAAPLFSVRRLDPEVLVTLQPSLPSGRNGQAHRSALPPSLSSLRKRSAPSHDLGPSAGATRALPAVLESSPGTDDAMEDESPDEELVSTGLAGGVGADADDRPGARRRRRGGGRQEAARPALHTAIQLPPGAETAAKAIDRASLEAPLRFLADDLLEGRGPASRGDETAQLYLASNLEALGYQPALPHGEWQQRFEVVGIKSEAPKEWEFKAAGGSSVALKWWDDYIGASGVQEGTSTLRDAELVFVGYGIQAPEYSWDDFKGMNLKGKVLVMMNNDPDWDPKLFEGNRRLYYGRWTYKYESAARQGAAAAIIIHTTPSAGYPWQVVQTSWSGEQFELPAAGEPRLQMRTWMTEEGANRLFQAAGKDLAKLIEQARSRDFKPVPLGLTTSLSFANKISKVKTANVLGVLPGSDPALKGEMVVFTAHHDHLGIGQPDKTGDKIYNGAEDNASGCAEVMAIAKAFAALP